MPLTPIDVQQKTFATALRGYDLDEVDDFLDAVVVALKDYDQRLSDAQERISTLEAELNDKGDAEGAIARALVAAQRSADAIVADAKEQAQRILADADTEANELADTREAERRRLQAEIDDLRGRVSSVRSSVAELAAAIPVTLDEIDEVLDANTDRSAGATFDAAVPVGGYEIAPEPEVGAVETPDTEVDLTSSDAVDDEPANEDHPEDEDRADDRGALDVEQGDHARHLAVDEPFRELPAIEDLSQRIDSAFDDVVAEADEMSEGAQRPWEDG
jgi:cell division initiation protein